MRNKCFIIMLALLAGFSSLMAKDHEPLRLWYDSPAENWEEALPVGNGRLGAMVWGGVEKELIQLNEETLWSGRPVDLNPNPAAIDILPQVREALRAFDFSKAQSLCRQMQGYYTESYLPLGDLAISQDLGSGYTLYNYTRELNLSEAVASTHFEVNGVRYDREVFAQSDGRCIIIKYKSSRKHTLKLEMNLSSQLQYQIEGEKGGLLLKGRAPVHVEPSYVNSPNPIVYERDGHKGMRFGVLMLVDAPGARVSIEGERMTISDGSEVVMKIMAATSFNGFDKDPDTEGKDELRELEKDAATVRGKSYETLRRNHVMAYRRYFNRVSLSLGSSQASKGDTRARLLAYRTGVEDVGLEALYYQFNRYLMISCSRPGGYPANLQGIWNKELRAPWSSNYTININAEMNYWPVEAANLSELHLPFIDMVGRFARNGAATAQNFYGTRGWALSHNSDIWAQTNPVGNKGDGDPAWANWYVGSPWVAQHLYEHYRFTCDEDYLRTVFPVMKEAALFCLDWLMPDGSGHLVTAPSTSPENRYRTADGGVYSVTTASTMDMSVIWELFTDVIEASATVGDDPLFVKQVEEARASLLPLQVGSKGQLQEWREDYEDHDPHHRHVSHLFGLFPGRQITPFSTPTLAKACRTSLRLRGDNGTGWSLAWKINLWARLLDGNHAYLLLRNLLNVVSEKGENYDGGGSYANLFCAHPPFQIDGNFGGLSGMNQMLLQSHDQVITLLPALPDAWGQGEVTGMKARGGFTIGMCWADRRLQKATVASEQGGQCTLRTSVPIRVKGTTAISRPESTDFGKWYVTTFPTVQGRKYEILPDSSFANGLSADDLLCEHLTDPLGVGVSHPAFSWTVRSSSRNTVQASYRILVSASREALLRDEGDVWDSGVCQSDHSINIPYAGKKLHAGQNYYWKVMVADNHGNVSEWSRQAVFRMGLLTDDDWSGARWIAYDTIPCRYNVVPGYQMAGNTMEPLDHEPVMPQFRKAFTLQPKEVQSAIASVCGLGQFKMTVNGQRVGDHFLDPAWTNYDKTSLYVTFDITPLLQEGDNVLGVQLGNGFLHIPRDSSRYIKLITTFSAPKLICKLQVTYSDGSQQNIVTDESWKVTASPVTFSSVYGGEDYDARKELEGWDTPGYDDSQWQAPVTVPSVGRLLSQFQHPVKVKQVNRPVSFQETRPGVYIYDFGQNASAILSLQVSGPAGSRVTMRPAEYLTDDGLANQNNSGNPYYFSYTLKGKGTEAWTPAFSYYGFRYVQVEGAVPAGERNPEGLPVIDELTQLHVSADSRAVGSFECSNDLFNRICRLIDWSIRSNLMHVMTDCPHREKLGWLEQTHLMGPSLVFCYDVSLLFRKALMDMNDAQTADGLIPDTAPEYAQFPHDFRDSPEWGSAGVILPWFLYEWYGDKSVLSDNYELMQRYVDYLTSRAKDGLLFHGLGDWYDLGPNHPGYSQLTARGLTPTAFYYHDLRVLAMTAGVLGKEQDREKYEKMASDVRTAFNARFFDPSKGYYDKGSQTANALPLCFGLAPDPNRTSCIQQIVNDIRSRGNSITSGDIGFAYLLRILEAEGHPDVIFDMNSQSEKPGYGYQLKEGATSLTESWSALKTASHNHCMLGHLMEWFYVGIGGIRLDDSSIAFRTFDLRPDIVGDLTYAKVDFQSPLGLISSHWSLRDDKLEYDVVVPVGATARVWMPCDNASSILESGKPVEQATGIAVSHPREGYSVLTVGSGSYHFVSPYKN